MVDHTLLNAGMHVSSLTCCILHEKVLVLSWHSTAAVVPARITVGLFCPGFAMQHWPVKVLNVEQKLCRQKLHDSVLHTSAAQH